MTKGNKVGRCLNVSFPVCLLHWFCEKKNFYSDGTDRVNENIKLCFNGTEIGRLDEAKFLGV